MDLTVERFQSWMWRAPPSSLFFVLPLLAGLQQHNSPQDVPAPVLRVASCHVWLLLHGVFPGKLPHHTGSGIPEKHEQSGQVQDLIRLE